MDLSRFLPPWSGLLPSLGRRHRRAWVGDGRAHIEVRASSRPGSEPLAERLKGRLEQVEGVDWAEVNGVVGRVVVAFDPGSTDVDAVLDAVEEVEQAAGVEGEHFSHTRVEHPGDGESAQAAALGLAADVAGLGLSVTGRVLNRLPLPSEIGAVVTFAESQPPVRAALSNVVGPLAADVSLTAVNAVAMALTQGPLGLVVDAGHRLNLLAAARAREALWERREADLVRHAEDAHRAPPAVPERPVPLPDGAVETYLRRSGGAGLAGGAITAVTMRSLRRGAAMMLATTGKPARLGREAYTSWLELALARRGVLVVDQQAVRRLDRVDCVLLPREALDTGTWQVRDAVVLDDVDHADPHHRLRALFDPADPHRTVRRGKWSIGPWPGVSARRSQSLDRALARLASDRPMALVRDQQVVLVFDVVPQLAPAGVALVEAAHHNGLTVAVAGHDPTVLERLRADVVLDGSGEMVEMVTALQAEGRTVAVVASHDHAALRAADVGIGLHRDGGPPWGADLVVTELEEVWLLLEACGVAHEVARQSNAIALSGSSVGSLTALTAPERLASGRAATAVNVATVASMANAVRAAVLLDRRPFPRFEVGPRWHELPRAEVLERLGTSVEGLPSDEARARTEPGERALPAPLRFAQAVGSEMANPLTPVLAGSALLSATVGGVADAGIVSSVMALNGVLSGVQRFAADESVRGLLRAGEVSAHVRRDGELVELPARQLVPGDVVALEVGDTVPADCRILRSRSLEVDESSLTGESEPVAKRSAASFATALAERRSMLYADTAVVAGSATGVVVAVGAATEAAGNGDRNHTGDERGSGSVGVEARLRELSSISLPVAGASGLVLTAGQLLRGLPVQTSLASGVSLAVAAVPEGLPMLATVAQLSAARRLSSRSVLVRNPRAVEALGRVDVLCVDKTGTLTEGRVALTSVTDGRKERGVDDLRGRDRRLLRTAAIASPNRENERAFAHVTDTAVREAADTVLGAEDPELGRGERVAELPFGPKRAFHARWEDHDGKVVLSLKGAPEQVLDRCTRWRRGRKHRSIGDGERRELEEHIHALAGRGLRVLGVAERRYATRGAVPPTPGDDDVVGLDLLGFVALSDPIRTTAAEAVAGLRTAGVRTVMVTGDHPMTATGIAADLGILAEGRIVTGVELARMSDGELDEALAGVSVFARVSPADKVRIVAAYQRAGRSVAMTGDGANDARAIRRADVGIAVGRRSTATARSSADVIITDDRIETIVAAIVEGRALWASVRDALAILLGGNLGEIGFILLSGGLTGQPSLSPRQVLLVNLFTDVVPSLAIASRPPPGRTGEELALEGPEQSLGTQLEAAIVQRALATTAGATAAWGVGRLTGSPRRASTIGLGAVVGTQLGQTIAAGHFDPVVVVSAVGSAAVLAGIIQTPGVSQFFGCTPLGPVGWTIVVGSSVTATVAAATFGDRLEGVVEGLGSLAERLPSSLPSVSLPSVSLPSVSLPALRRPPAALPAGTAVEPEAAAS